MTIRIDISQLPKALVKLDRDMQRARHRGVLSCAIAGVAWIKMTIASITPHPPVNSGAYRNAWNFRVEPFGASIYNQNMPIAGIIDRGVKPADVRPGEAMRSALEEWVKQKGIASSDEAPRVASAIMWKIKRTGLFQDPQFRITDRAVEWLKGEVGKHVAAEMDRVKFTGG
jgi:hypothetical protein